MRVYDKRYYVEFLIFQTCDELGFTYSDKEWVQIRNMLLERSTENSQDLPLMVKSQDFFSALHTIMTNKQNRLSEAANLKVRKNSDLHGVSKSRS